MKTPVLSLATFVGALAIAGSAVAFEPSNVECIAPANPGGGWDFTCRSVGKILYDLKLVPEPVKVTNMPGGGGGVAFGYTRRQAQRRRQPSDCRQHRDDQPFGDQPVRRHDGRPGPLGRIARRRLRRHRRPGRRPLQNPQGPDGGRDGRSRQGRVRRWQCRRRLGPSEGPDPRQNGRHQGRQVGEVRVVQQRWRRPDPVAGRPHSRP